MSCYVIGVLCLLLSASAALRSIASVALLLLAANCQRIALSCLQVKLWTAEEPRGDAVPAQQQEL